ncbi:MAG TPA: PEGA domain-containing protein [Kofleriaceae bacterium]|nr:PEGA domain-containing protein [Kofleriaceae bacterium]
MMKLAGRRFAAACLIVMALVDVAAADNREEAGKEFSAGQAADNVHDSPAAIEHYLKSYELVPHPATAYNIALNYEKLHKYRQAAAYYQRYLDGSSDPPDRIKVQKIIADLQAKPGRVTVRTSPAGGQITIDDKPAEQEPLKKVLAGGPHRIVALVNGQTQSQDIEVAFGEDQDVMVAFVPQSGSLTILSTVPATQLWVDGQMIGQAPTAIALPPGQHQIAAQAVGWAPQTKPVVVEAGRASQITFTLVRGPGNANGNSDSNGNNSAYGTTPPSTTSFMGAILAGPFFPISGGGNSVGVVEPEFGFRWNSGELYARFALATEEGNFSSYGIGYRLGPMNKQKTHLYYAFNIGFSPQFAFDGRVGVALAGVLGRRVDVYAELGLGYTLASGSGSTVAYLPAVVGLAFHK